MRSKLSQEDTGEITDASGNSKFNQDHAASARLEGVTAYSKHRCIRYDGSMSTFVGQSVIAADTTLFPWISDLELFL